MDNWLKVLKDNLEWLSTHNKNYTKQQYYTIEDCLEIVEKHLNNDLQESKKLKEDKDIISSIGKYFNYHIPLDFQKVMGDLVDRAMFLYEGDIDEAVMEAIDEGLIYRDDIWAVKKYYEEAQLADFTIDKLYDAIYSIVNDLLHKKDDEEEG